MATRGRKPKPTAQKVLEGNPGKRRLTVGEPRPGASQVRRMPRGLSPRAQELWHRLADDMADLGMFSDVDIPAFMLMAEHYAVARAALVAELLRRYLALKAALSRLADGGLPGE